MSTEMQVFLLPDLGEGLTEAELVNWLVAVGDEIRVDQPIAEVETAKSMVEVPSPYAGIVAVLHGEAGQTLDVGKPLISVAPVGASVAVKPEPEPAEEKVPAAPAVAVAAETYRTEEKAGSGNVLIGYGTSGGGEARRTRPRKMSGGSAVAVTSEPDFAQLSLSRTRIPGKLSAVISPLVRKMARDHGVSLDAVPGSGESGLILRRDIEAAIGGATRETAPVEVPAVTQSSSGVQPSTGVQDARTGLTVASRTPVRGIRKAVAANMTRSRSEIPEATVWVDVDATALLEMRAELKKRDPHGAPGLLAFIARFVTAGLKKFPELNTRFVTAEDTAGGVMQEIIAFDGINLGFAAQTDRGLVVPSVRNAHLLNARELDTEIRRLTAVARDGKATPTELASGTFTLNNYGVFGVDGSAAIINYPEVAMLGVGRIIDKPWVVDGQLAVRKVTELTLAFDHRVCDGETAAGFLRYVADAIENPGTVLADL
ncbi:dihydrolipoamide acetyltransferase family protein [Arthrobacter bambusae]|uniref:Dihydrolipoamide acetyltransferase component of pyruvate dehydrogenase complex n=1 Tax=Arthrobacter bambusae TaxID=1338426 RepID=A0AAW8DBJ9_9MICC|nr:dihydrolipoamide acetyltransferase family protein [Arthrobacter bambusae]MDP9903645.1 pyruvate dehydrogenase E2 component (dihydrolipoamide acetyltransferase) [Arthrobacter bambusae]MDQ0128361.1 pyruvate dehydrogenase E2 component (dihydrolipoamide acetyltransferase) [Arthrobacter bambusae]MDQ0179702.1 pyruvate dehydrogenase E2 component (dihydrolipoamide acetyltransferase) [Arthrobacter bambusae]